MSAELEGAIAKLAQSEAALRVAVSGLSVAQWQWKPEPSCWSIGDCCEHLLIAELGIVFRLRSASAEGFEKTAGKDEIVERVTVRSQRLQAPERLLPKGKFANPAEFFEKMASVRAATLEWALHGETKLLEHVMPHMAFGEMHGLQWLLLIAGHTLRHIHQIDEVKASPGYPPV